MVGPRELESLTSCVSSRRSNQLSYGPATISTITCRRGWDRVKAAIDFPKPHKIGCKRCDLAAGPR